jgi:hypothetical protein
LPTAARFWRRGRAHTRSRSAQSGNYSSDAAEALASSDDGGDLLRAQLHKRNAVDERHAHDYQLKANLFVTMQEEIGTAKRMVRVSRDALTSKLLWALLQCGDNCLPWEEHERPSIARFATGADIVSWMRVTTSTLSRWQRADVCQLARGLVPRVAGRDGAVVSPQAASVPRECSSTAATSSIRRRAARCSTTTRLSPAAEWRWKCYAELDQLCNPKSNSAAMRAAAALRARSGRDRRLTMRACST